MAQPLLSPEQLEAFETTGAVTLDALGDRAHPLLDGLEAMLDEHAAPDAAEDGGHRSMVDMAIRMRTGAFLDSGLQ